MEASAHDLQQAQAANEELNDRIAQLELALDDGNHAMDEIVAGHESALASARDRFAQAKSDHDIVVQELEATIGECVANETTLNAELAHVRSTAEEMDLALRADKDELASQLIALTDQLSSLDMELETRTLERDEMSEQLEIARERVNLLTLVRPTEMVLCPYVPVQ